MKHIYGVDKHARMGRGVVARYPRTPNLPTPVPNGTYSERRREGRSLTQRVPTVGTGGIIVSKQPEVVITDESFADAFVSSMASGLNWARRVLEAASKKYSDIPDTPVINAEAILIRDRLTRDGYKGSTLKNRPSVARKILRVHTVLPTALDKCEADKNWPRPARGFDQQTFEKMVTCAAKLEKENGKLPTAAAVHKSFVALMSATPNGKTPAQKCAAGFKAMLKSGTGAAKWTAVIDAAVKEATKQGLQIPE